MLRRRSGGCVWRTCWRTTGSCSPGTCATGTRRADQAVPTGASPSVALQLLQQHQLPTEVGGAAEVLVHAGEAHVGDLVQAAQLLEHGEAELGGGDLRPV